MPFRSVPRRALAAMISLAIVAALTLATIAPVAAHGSGKDHDNRHRLPTRVELPDGFQPEGIESWGRWLYAGSLADGAIWRGSAKTGHGKLIVEGTEGASAAGLHIDQRGRLWVAGADSQTIRVYSASSGKLLQTYTFPSAGFINDLDIVDGAVYATDSVNQQLLVIPLEKRGKRLPAPEAATTLPLTGTIAYTDGFNANGIVAIKGALVLVQSNTGLLFKVDPETGVTETIDTGGVSVTAGDGLERKGRWLYVVRNQENLVALFRLSKDLLSARSVGDITADEGVLDVPTTATLANGKLYVVNARFGTTPEADTEYWITRLPRWP